MLLYINVYRWPITLNCIHPGWPLRWKSPLCDGVSAWVAAHLSPKWTQALYARRRGARTGGRGENGEITEVKTSKGTEAHTKQKRGKKFWNVLNHQSATWPFLSWRHPGLYFESMEMKRLIERLRTRTQNWKHPLREKNDFIPKWLQWVIKASSSVVVFASPPLNTMKRKDYGCCHPPRANHSCQSWHHIPFL